MPGFLVISSFISPYRADRERARKAAGEGAFHEIYIEAPIEVCEQRDPKGLYKRARTGEIPEFTGVSSPYEAPESAELVLRTDQLSVEECLAELAAYVERAFAPESLKPWTTPACCPRSSRSPSAPARSCSSTTARASRCAPRPTPRR